MTNGVNISVDEFKNMKHSDQNAILFMNVGDIKEMMKDSNEKFRNHEKTDWKHQRIVYIAIIVLASVVDRDWETIL